MLPPMKSNTVVGASLPVPVTSSTYTHSSVSSEPSDPSPLLRLVSLSMDSHSQPPSLLVICGKSSAENDLATSLKSTDVLHFSDNSEFIVRLFSEFENSNDELPFDFKFYMDSLSTTLFGRFLIWSPRINSTQDVVSQKFCELPIGSVCVADVQTKGRGRSANVWESPKGCLLFSYTIQMENGRIVPFLQYIVSLAVSEAIKAACDKKGLPQLNVRIKWPNDLYLNGLKVGGILCTSTYTSKKFNVTAGIGLNVDNREPTTCLNACLQEIASFTCQLQNEEIMASFFNKFEEFFDLFILQGFQPLEELYYKTWLHSGQRIIVKDTAEDQSMNSEVTIQGLTSTGYLLAVSDDGQICELHPDGNSFDFFKGLLRTKLN